MTMFLGVLYSVSKVRTTLSPETRRSSVDHVEADVVRQVTRLPAGLAATILVQTNKSKTGLKTNHSRLVHVGTIGRPNPGLSLSLCAIAVSWWFARPQHSRFTNDAPGGCRLKKVRGTCRRGKIFGVAILVVVG